MELLYEYLQKTVSFENVNLKNSKSPKKSK